MASIASAILLLVLAPAAILGDRCKNTVPEGVLEKDFGDKCYAFFVDNDKDYLGAEATCKEYGGALATAKTESVNTFLAAALKSTSTQNRAWIGLDDRNLEETFVWSDGTALDFPSDYHAFMSESEGPRVGVTQYYEDCVAIDVSGSWHDYRCVTGYLGPFHYSNHRDYICEFQRQSTATKTTLQTDKTEKTTETMKMTTEATASMGPTTQAACKQLEDCALDCEWGLEMNPLTGCTLCMCRLDNEEEGDGWGGDGWDGR